MKVPGPNPSGVFNGPEPKKLPPEMQPVLNPQDTPPRSVRLPVTFEKVTAVVPETRATDGGRSPGPGLLAPARKMSAFALTEIAEAQAGAAANPVRAAAANAAEIA
ncbi:polyprotein [Burkholderiales bacterium GJ-E10]|nr:polyprotein [Burkholderiales bacterium GJ-E10]